MKTLMIYFIFPISIVTVIIGLIYAGVQQCYRTAANDPQIQVAQNIVHLLRKGVSIDKIIPQDTVDIASSLSTFAALYDESGRPIVSTGYLDGKMIELPAGVFSYLKDHEEDWISWQPRPGVRMAMVVTKSSPSPALFVAVGRSLEQVELREHSLTVTVFIGWLICVVLVTLLGIALSPKNI